MRHLICSFAVLVVSSWGCARGDATPALPPTTVPAEGGFVLRTLVDSGVTWKYQVFVPKGFTRAKRWPVIVFLHGNTEKGTDGDRQTRSALGPVLRARHETFPAVVVFPQSPVGDWPQVHPVYERVALAALASTMQEFQGDSDRVYLTGASYGSVVAFDLAYRFPARFAALVPVASGNVCCVDMPNPTPTEVASAFARRLRRLPVWMFRGAADPVALSANIHLVRDAFQAGGGPFRFTEYDGAGHAVWDRVYADPDLYTWLFAQRRTHADSGNAR